MSLAWQMVRRRFAAFAGTFLAIAAGVAVVAGATTVYLSSRPQTPARYGQAPVLVQAPRIADLDNGRADYAPWSATGATALANRLATVSGVTAAIAVPTFYAQRADGGRAVGDAGTALTEGHAWSSARLGGYRITVGVAPAGDGEVALSGFAPGSRVDVLTAAGPVTWTVIGTTDGPGFYVPDATARRLASGERVIGLTVNGDAKAVADAARQAIGDEGIVLAGHDRDSLEPESVSRIRWLGAQLLIALVALGAFVTVFVVASTCALSAAQRRREIGLLRAVGATPGQVRLLRYAETVVVATLAGLVAVPVGALAAPLLAGPLVDAGLEPAGFTVTVQPLALAGALLLGLIAAIAGTVTAAHRSSRVSPLEALHEAAIERRAMTRPRWITGLVALGGGVASFVALTSIAVESRGTAALGGAMLLLTAAGLLSPVVVVPAVRLITWPWRGSASGMLVRQGTLNGVRRVASTAAPVLLTVGFSVLFSGAIATLADASGIEDASKIPAAAVLAPDGTPGLSEAAVRTQNGASGLATRLFVKSDDGLKGLDATGTSGVHGLVLPPDVAKHLNAKQGTILSVRWADGTDGQVQVSDVRAGAGIQLPRQQARLHDPGALTQVVELHGPPVAVAGARATTARDYVQADIDDDQRLVDLFLTVLIGLGVGYTGLAVANTLLMATAARRAEFRAMRLAGAGLSHVLRVTSAEALLAVAVGTTLGGAVAVGAVAGIRHTAEQELHQAVHLVLPWGYAAVVTAACALIALAATALPIWHRRSHPLAEAIT